MIMNATKADNGHSNTIVPAPGAHKKRPALPKVSHAKPKTAKPTKAETAAAAVAKMRQANLSLTPQPAPTELVMMPLTLIETRAQVRTEFNDDSLAELAADIAARGVLQPILLRPMPDRCNYLVIAGERRLRAARLAGLENIPAIIGQIDDAAAEDMQLAENIQREDLNLADTATAVRKIYDRCGSVTETAAKVRKSKSWVSKHVAASCPDLRHQAKEILEGGFSEDLEIILLLDKLQALDWYGCRQLCEKIKKGEAGRQTARETYEKAKAEKERRDAENEAHNSPEIADRRKAESEANAQRWKEQQAEQDRLAELDPRHIAHSITSTGETVPEDREELTEEQTSILTEHLDKLWTSGVEAKRERNIHDLVKMIYSEDYAVIEIAAYVRRYDRARIQR